MTERGGDSLSPTLNPSESGPAARKAASSPVNDAIAELLAIFRGLDPLAYILIALFAVLFSDAAQMIWQAWTKDQGYYSHGPLIPLFTAWMLFSRREELSRIPVRPNWWGGLPLIVLCSLVFLASTLCHMYPPKYMAFVFYTLGLSLLLFGNGITRAILLPWSFLFFMVPLPDGLIDLITYKMRIFVTAAAVGLSEPFGWHVVKSGNYIFLPLAEGGAIQTLVVGDVCAGLRSLISLLALGAFFAYFSKLTPLGAIILFFLSAPIAVVTNALRILGLIVVARYWGSEAASGKVHDASGWAIFAVALGFLFLFHEILLRVLPKRPQGNPVEEKV